MKRMTLAQATTEFGMSRNTFVCGVCLTPYVEELIDGVIHAKPACTCDAATNPRTLSVLRVGGGELGEGASDRAL